MRRYRKKNCCTPRNPSIDQDAVAQAIAAEAHQGRRLRRWSFNSGSIKVGCTSIDNATVRAIASKLID
jgi:hypothetical protein